MISQEKIGQSQSSGPFDHLEEGHLILIFLLHSLSPFSVGFDPLIFDSFLNIFGAGSFGFFLFLLLLTIKYKVMSGNVLYFICILFLLEQPRVESDRILLLIQNYEAKAALESKVSHFPIQIYLLF